MKIYSIMIDYIKEIFDFIRRQNSDRASKLTNIILKVCPKTPSLYYIFGRRRQSYVFSMTTTVFTVSLYGQMTTLQRYINVLNLIQIWPGIFLLKLRTFGQISHTFMLSWQDSNWQSRYQGGYIFHLKPIFSSSKKFDINIKNGTLFKKVFE